MSEHKFLSALSVALRSDVVRDDQNHSNLDLAGINGLLNEDIVSRLNDEENMNMETVLDYECDVLIITPIIKELRLAALAFGCDFENPTGRDKNLPIFAIDLKRGAGLPPIQIKLTTLNAQRNLNSGPGTGYLIGKHKPRVAILSGIAAIKAGKALGESSAFSSVQYVAGGVDTPTGKEPENQINNISDTMNNLICSYEDRRDLDTAKLEFRATIFELISQIDGETPSEKDLEKFDPKFGVKKLLSGETLRKDGGFTQQAESIDRLITMVEMEASGFAVACELANVDWVVFRASCDYADPEKNDKWQRVAALNSALAVKHCLETGYRNAEEMSY